MYGLAFTGMVLYYVYYTGDYSGQCKLHEFFISFNLVRNVFKRIKRQF